LESSIVASKEYVGKRPSFQFYPGDWMRDPGVRGVSFAAKGLWIDLLCLMFEGDSKGYLSVAGKPVSMDGLSRMTGCPEVELTSLLGELRDWNVFSTAKDGTIYSRRMVKDEEERKQTRRRVNRHRKSNGAGNEDVMEKKRSSNGNCNGDVTVTVTQMYEGEEEDEDPSKPEDNKPNKVAKKITAQEFADIWNSFDDFSSCLAVKKTRLASFRARMKDKHWRENWREALVRIAKSDFCCGRVNGWKADVDWFLRPDTVTRILEGKYDNKHAPKESPTSSFTAAEQMEQEKQWKAELEAERKTATPTEPAQLFPPPDQGQ
jgi:hypothetical protein